MVTCQKALQERPSTWNSSWTASNPRDSGPRDQCLNQEWQNWSRCSGQASCHAWQLLGSGGGVQRLPEVHFKGLWVSFMGSIGELSHQALLHAPRYKKRAYPASVPWANSDFSFQFVIPSWIGREPQRDEDVWSIIGRAQARKGASPFMIQGSRFSLLLCQRKKAAVLEGLLSFWRNLGLWNDWL